MAAPPIDARTRMGPGLASSARERALTLLIRQGSGELPRAGFMAVVFSRKPGLASIPSKRCTCILGNGWPGQKGRWAENGLCIRK